MDNDNIQATINCYQQKTSEFIDYIEINEGSNSKNYKLKSFSSSVEKLLNLFDHELATAFNSNFAGTIYESTNSADGFSNNTQSKSLNIVSLDNKVDNSENSSGDDWADYISRLGKLNKLLNTLSTDDSIDVLPYSDQINKHLIMSLNKSLPSGVHTKTLEVYLQIFNIIGHDNLSKQFDLWILGMLPLMEFCKISVKKVLIDEIFGKWVLQLKEDVLKRNLVPLIKCLFSGIEKDSTDVVALLNKLKLKVQNDFLFMNCVCTVLIESGLQGNNLELKMNCLIWLNDSPNNNLLLCIKDQTDSEVFLKAILECVNIKDTSNNSDDVLCCRGYLDYMIKNQLYFNNNKIFCHSSDHRSKNTRYLIDKILSLLLIKDASINRRIFQYMIPQDCLSKDAGHNGKEYFKEYLFPELISCLRESHDTMSIIAIIKFLIIKWEDIGSLVFEKLILKIMDDLDLNSMSSINSLSQLLEIVDSHLILRSLLSDNQNEHKHDQLFYIKKMIHIVKDDDDEMLIKHFPMLMIYLMTSESYTTNAMHITLVDKIIQKIPQRAFFTISEESTLTSCFNITHDDLKRYNKTLKDFYICDTSTGESTKKTLPFHMSDFLTISVKVAYDTLITLMTDPESLNISSSTLHSAIKLFISLYTRLPEFQHHPYLKYEEINKLLLDIFSDSGFSLKYESLTDLIDLYKACVFDKVFEFNKTDLKSINKSLMVIKTFKAIINSMVYPKLFDSSISFEYVSILNQMISINEKYSIKFLLESLLNDKVNKKQKKLEMLKTLIFKKNKTEKNSQNFGFFIHVIDHLLLVGDSAVSDWLKENLLSDDNSVYFHRLIDHYFINLLSSGLHAENNDPLLSTIGSLSTIVAHVLDYDLTYLNKEAISSKLKNIIQDTNNTYFFRSGKNQTYQDLLVNILIECLKKNKVSFVDNYIFYSKTLSLLESCIAGNEHYVIGDVINITSFALRQNEHIESTENDDFVVCKVTLIKILTKLITNSDISERNELILKFLDFIVSSIDLIKNYDVMANFIFLLEVSYIQLDGNDTIDDLSNTSDDLSGVSVNKNKIIFNIVLPLGTTLLNKLQSEFQNELIVMKGSDFEFFNILMDGVSELLETCNNQIKEQKISLEQDNNTFRSKNDFFTSVFNSNSKRNNELDSMKSKLLINEQIVDQYFNMVLNEVYNLWVMTNSKILELKSKDIFNYTSLVMILQNYKHKIKTFLQHNYNTRPFELLRALISLDTVDLNELSSLIISLDGNRPSLTVPKVLTLMERDNMDVNYLKFIDCYLNILETSTIEEVFDDIFEYFKTNLSSLDLEQQHGVYTIKILSKIGNAIKFDSKKLSTSFFEILSKVVNFYIVGNQEAILNDPTKNKDIMALLETQLIPLFKKDSNDLVVNVIYSKIVSEIFKKKIDSLKKISDSLIDFLIAMTPHLSTSKNYKTNINNILSNNNNDFEIFEFNTKWNEYLRVILKSTILPEYTNSLINELFMMKNTFNWSKQEVLTKTTLLIRKLIMIINIGFTSNVSNLLMDFVLRNYDFKNIDLYRYQVHLVSVVLNDNEVNSSIHKQEIIEFIANGLRNFYHYYIHNKGVITNLNKNNKYDLGFFYLLRIISNNKNSLVGENVIWTNLFAFKELVMVDVGTENETWIHINKFEDISKFILSFDSVLIENIRSI
ncbi:hypothetical protein ACO0R3_002872 [Hanseniaspora guilliermondii]